MKHYSIDAEQVTWEITDGEAVVIHFETSAYYALNPSGTYLWSCLAEGPGDLKELTEKIAAHYGKVSVEIAADVDVFLKSLEAEGLVTEQASSKRAAGGEFGRLDAGIGYQPPELTRFGELEKLILSGE